MFQHILIPVDFSERNRAAVDFARDMAKQSAARITLIHVIETIEYLSVTEMRDFYNRLERSARQGMAELTESFSGQSISVENVILLGKRHDEIIRYAMENRVDLIVMSSHRVDPDRPAANFGSISYRVAVLAPCAVLLLKNDKT
jgi:nucleotide-binding universal stress UspA family protein